MSRECAFCPSTADLTGEHLWSHWMDDLFPGKKRFTSKNEKGEIIKQWEDASLSWKAKVVCRRCNNGWMSDMESKHAKPAMTGLIRGNEEATITKSHARSIALFGFKTAVIFDHMQRGRVPFFPQRARYRFRQCLAIPFNVSMWLAGFLPIGKGEVHTSYHDGTSESGNRLELYVCTYAVGHLAFQVVAARQTGLTLFSPGDGFEHLAIPFWPRLRLGTRWPPNYVLRTVGDFDEFSRRWETIIIR